MSSTLINTLKMNLYSFLGSLTLLLFFANANANNCGAVINTVQYDNENRYACNCTNGEIVACDDLSGLTQNSTFAFFPSTFGFGVSFTNLTKFDGSFLANSAVTILSLDGYNLTTENIINFPSSVTFLAIQNGQLTNFDGSFLADSSVTRLRFDGNNLTTENITNFPSSVRELDLRNFLLTNFDGSFLTDSGVTILHLNWNIILKTENIANFPSSVTYLDLQNSLLTNFDGSFLANSSVTSLGFVGPAVALIHGFYFQNIINFPSSVINLGLSKEGLNGFNGSFLANSNVQNVYLSGNKTDILPQNITNRPPNITIKFEPFPIPEITPTTPTPTPTSSEKLSTALIIVIAISSFIFVAGGLYALYLKCNGKGGNYWPV